MVLSDKVVASYVEGFSGVYSKKAVPAWHWDCLKCFLQVF
jgi:hypothetical protein